MTLRLVLYLSLAVKCLTVYHHSWSVRIHPSADPRVVAQELSMVYLGPIGSLPHRYLFKHNGYPRHSYHHAGDITRRIFTHKHVLDTTQQQLHRRQKRAFEDRTIYFNDPDFEKQWYLYQEYNNVTGAWVQGATGNGVVVTILDDGLEYLHPDIKDNYEPRASTDLNDNDDDPVPRYEQTNENKHGTRCAGEVASVGGNKYCGVGAAFHAKIGGIRMLDGDVTDAVEAKALGLRPDFIDIYSASWGPDDDGKTVDGPGSLTVESFKTGIAHGRNGLGSIFVWASGNGGNNFDNCNCDGYTNSIWTMSIGSVSEKGTKPWYSEKCSSTLAVTYSSGSGDERQIMTTDLHGKCTARHTGTSASAPLAAGIFALALQAHPLLTWRDLQHLVVRTCKRRNIAKDYFTANSAGYSVSHMFGFGVIDAGGLVELARLWNNVPEKTICKESMQLKKRTIPAGGTATFPYISTGCEGKILHLEHVQCEVTTGSGVRRGSISLLLTSPTGTQSILLGLRKSDTNQMGFKAWPFMTVHNWGEDPRGQWMLTIDNTENDELTVESWRLILHGTDSLPTLRNTSRPIANSGNITSVTDSFFRSSRNGGIKMLSVTQILLTVIYPVLVVSFSQ